MVRVMSRRAGNLPAELTRLVGRRAESAEVRRLLGASRLVTLIGPGGAGKTRLALQVGRAVRRAFRDGVWLLALADVTHPDLLPSTVLSTLGKPGPAGTGIAEVADHIGDRQMLLILDNCEHLIEVCAKLTTELLRSCPNVRVLATSREPLRVAGEALLRVPPLSLPEPGQLLQPGASSRFDAVALFLERASALNPEFSLREADEQAVIALCRRLDGLPLAIELAAAGTRLAPINELMSWADDPLLAAALGSRSAPSRHQTLRATMEYSFKLCSPHGRTVWARMSVFRGGADLDAIEEVCGGDALSSSQVRAALAELVDKSIATFDGARYQMLETIRQFGQECLQALAEEHAIRRAHRDRFVELAAEVDSGRFGPDQPALLGRVLKDEANVRAALEFCLAEDGEVGVGLRMASALSTFWVGCGRLAEGRLWLDRLLAADDQPTPERVTALYMDGYLSAVAGDILAGRALLGECRQLAGHFDDEASIAVADLTTGVADFLEGRLAEAICDLDDALPRLRNLGGREHYLAEALLYLGSALCFQNSPERAVEVLEEARALCARHGEQLLLSWTWVYLGLAALLDGRLPEAEALVKDALIRKRALGDTLGIVLAVEVLAWAALANHDAERAARLLAAAEAMSKPLGTHLAGHQRPLEWHAQYVQQAREVLGPRAFDAAARHGRQLTTDEVVDYALGKRTAPTTAASAPGADLPLTPREREIAELVATGKTNKEIAAELVIAPRTVDSHVEHILAKLSFTSRTQIAALFPAAIG